MTTEEKAKAYDKAIEKAKTLYNSVFVNNDVLEQMFPELKESEDERIRNGMLNSLKEAEDCIVLTPFEKKSWIAYLERQKEQKPAINIEHLKSYMLQYLQDASNREDDSEIDADTDKWAKMIIKVFGGVEQKPAEWREDDKFVFETACNTLEIHGHHKLSKMLRALQPRLKQKLPTWRIWKNGACGNANDIPIALVESYGSYKLVSSLGIDGQKYIMLSELKKLPGFNEKSDLE